MQLRDLRNNKKSLKTYCLETIYIKTYVFKKAAICFVYAHMLIVVALIVVKSRKPIYKKHIKTYIKTYI